MGCCGTASLGREQRDMLLSDKKKTNTHASIISQFDEVFVTSKKIDIGISFSELIYQINKYAPSKEFAEIYIKNSTKFLQKVRAYRTAETN